MHALSANVIMSIGPPGSGKTTFLQKLRTPNMAYVCADDIRDELSGEDGLTIPETTVWEKVHRDIAAALGSGTPLIIDVTNAKVENRRKLIDFCRHQGVAQIIGVYLTTPRHICLRRNKQRERKVPDRVIYRAWHNLEQDPPSEEDGFDQIMCVTTT